VKNPTEPAWCKLDVKLPQPLAAQLSGLAQMVQGYELAGRDWFANYRGPEKARAKGSLSEQRFAELKDVWDRYKAALLPIRAALEQAVKAVSERNPRKPKAQKPATA
jgi:hypothetical protein